MNSSELAAKLALLETEFAQFKLQVAQIFEEQRTEIVRLNGVINEYHLQDERKRIRALNCLKK